MIGCEFREEYRTVLTKLLRSCHEIEKEEKKANNVKVDIGEDIFDLDIIPFFTENGLKFTDMFVGPMGEEAEESFRKLFPL